jgi:hypothetical protein
MRLPSCNFCLKRHLGELPQFKTRLQFEWAQQLVRINPWLSFTPMEQGIMGKLAKIVTGVFEARQSHVGVKRCYRSKISKGGFIKSTSGLTEPMGGVTWSGVIGWAKEIEGSQSGSKGSRRLQGYTNTNHASKMEPSWWDSSCEKSNHEHKINASSCCWSTMTGGHLWIHQENFKIKISAPTLNLTWLWAAFIKINYGADMPGIWLGEQYNSYRRLFSLSNGYLHVLIW